MWIPVQKINYLCLFIILSIYRFDGFSQQQEKARAASDSAHVKGGALPVRADSTIAIQKDTTFQTTPPSALPSETKIRSDSTRPKATKSWISQKIHEAIFAPSPAPQADSAEFIKSENIFLPYEGRVIANIRLKKIEVLAGSVDDTLKAVESGFSRVLNSLSIPTKDHVIFNNLTFKVGERLSPSKMADSERLLRDLPFLEDARILVSPRDDSSQAVDAVIITKDRFPVGADLSVKQVNAFHAGVYDRNLIGYGTELRYTYFFDDDGNPRDRHEINYITTNIRGSFISGRLDYRQDVKTENLIISFDKKFLTPETKYGGGLDRRKKIGGWYRHS